MEFRFELPKYSDMRGLEASRPPRRRPSGLLAVTVNFGWLRTWFPTIPQIAIIILNPATVIVALYSAWSLWVLRRTGSIRMSAVALFTCFLAGFVVLTAMGSIFRGPNWHFYWWPSQWPTH